MQPYGLKTRSPISACGVKEFNAIITFWSKNQQRYFQIKNFNFEVVQRFTSLGSLINVSNDNSAEINKRILMANEGFYGLKRQVRSPLFGP